MDVLDRSLIHEYMHLDQKRQRSQTKLTRVKRQFRQQSFMHSPLAVDENGNAVHSARFDQQVNTLVDLEMLIQENSQELAFKRTYWHRYLNTLADTERQYLRQKYGNNDDIQMNLELDQASLNECNQIEEATAHRFNLELEEATDIERDVNKMMAQVLGMMA